MPEHSEALDIKNFYHKPIRECMEVTLRIKTIGFLVLVTLWSGCSTNTVQYREIASHEGEPIFKNMTKEVGLPVEFKANHTIVADLNNDNYLDLILTECHGKPIQTKVFINKNGISFQELKIVGFTPEASAILKVAKGIFSKNAWGILVRYPKKKLQGYNLKINEKNEAVFEPIESDKLPQVKSNWGDVQIFDYNKDGRLDILATSFYTGDGYTAGPLYLFKQNENGKFSDVSNKVGLGDLHLKSINSRQATVPTYSANVCDINNDGDLDLLISGYGRRWDKVLIHQEGKYYNKAYELKFDADDEGRNDFRGNGNSMIAQCADINNDGLIDVFQGEITHKWAGSTSDLSALLINNYPEAFTRIDNLPRKKDFDNRNYSA